MNAKLSLLLLGASMLPGLHATAQVVPTTPTTFGKKIVGSSTTTSSTVSQTGGTSASTGVSAPKVEPVVRTTTYIVLPPARQWTSSDGRPLLAKLIAFEDVTKEKPVSAGATTDSQPELPAKPTVIRDGKIRLLAGQRPYEVPLDKLSQADQDFIKSIKQGP